MYILALFCSLVRYLLPFWRQREQQKQEKNVLEHNEPNEHSWFLVTITTLQINLVWMATYHNEHIMKRRATFYFKKTTEPLSCLLIVQEPVRKDNRGQEGEGIETIADPR